MPTPSIDDQLYLAELFMHNAMAVPAIREAFAGIGRGADYFQQGEALLAEARRLHARQCNLYGGRIGATQELHEARSAAHETYVRHLSLARLAFEGDASAQKALLLTGPRQESYAGWIDQTVIFYDGLLKDEEMRRRIASFGVSREDLEAARGAARGVGVLRRKQLNKTGAAKEATAKRNAALRALAGWMRENKALARSE